MLKKLDIGCGGSKQDGFYGIDHHPFPGVDQVFDFNVRNWPLPESHFEYARASHVIEHVRETQIFLTEIHRICQHGAEVYFETPHFSWIDSWNDPTHLWHFSSGWYRRLEKGEYLSVMTGEYELIESRLEFNTSLRGWIPRIISKIIGVESYERYYAFMFPARNIHTRLRVIKK